MAKREVSPSSLAHFLSRSRQFHRHHPRPISRETTIAGLIEDGRLSEHDAVHHIQSTRIIVHPDARRVAADYLSHRKKHGSSVERHVYEQQTNWEVDRFLVRLIRQRPLSFYGSADTTLLRDHKFLPNAASLWDRVGTKDEVLELAMNDYLTYDEIFISSLIGVSGYTQYLNDGNRYNRGKMHFGGTQRQGVQVGLVGARFERPNKMDSLYRTSDRPFHYTSFFDGPDFESRYKARMRITVETLLLEAEQRGAEARRKVHLNVVGLGLGVWAVDRQQPRWYIELFTSALKKRLYRSIRSLEFAYIDVDDATSNNVKAAAKRLGMEVQFNRRAPSAALEDPNLLLITSYAWDANSYPGNEFYLGMLTASGDPAAACSSTISETQNPEVNLQMLAHVHHLQA